MANYRTLVRYFPAAQDYLQQRKWVRRGDVLAYAPGARTPSFSTDDFGFRHTRFEDRDIGIANIEDYERIGFVLGSSHIFGFPLGHNGETLPSRLSERFGYPVFGIAYPEADTRTLHATLLRLLRQFAKRTEHVILITGGDFTRYCYVEGADPLFGPPILPVDARFRPAADTETEFANFLHFTRFWTKACGELARSRYRLLPWRRHHLLREIHARRHGKGLRAWVGVRRGATEAVQRPSAPRRSVPGGAAPSCGSLPVQARPLPRSR